jgi:hypothetical protein
LNNFLLCSFYDKEREKLQVGCHLNQPSVRSIHVSSVQHHKAWHRLINTLAQLAIVGQLIRKGVRSYETTYPFHRLNMILANPLTFNVHDLILEYNSNRLLIWE